MIFRNGEVIEDRWGDMRFVCVSLPCLYLLLWGLLLDNPPSDVFSGVALAKSCSARALEHFTISWRIVWLRRDASVGQRRTFWLRLCRCVFYSVVFSLDVYSQIPLVQNEWAVGALDTSWWQLDNWFFSLWRNRLLWGWSSGWRRRLWLFWLWWSFLLFWL